MKKEEIMTFIAMAIIIIGEIMSQNYTKKSMEEMRQRLSELKQVTIERKYSNDEFEQKTQEIYELWEEKSKILSYYIEHDELEKVNTQIRTIKSDFEAELEDEAIPEIEKGIYILEHIEEKHQLSFKNVF